MGSKVKDLTGERFGMLTVLERAPDYVSPKGKKYHKWRCLCDCGNVVDVIPQALVRGHTKSCGCQTLKDLTRKRFGSLTVLERAPDHVQLSGGKKVKWKCLCDCGNVVDILAGNLIRGRTKSCGCQKFKDFTGKRFGMLIVLERAPDYESPSGRKFVKWRCLCECGSYVDVFAHDLAGGFTKSCGCIQSRGEYFISQILTERNVIFEREFSFKDLLSSKGSVLYFDFAIRNKDRLECLIEFQGEQHYKNCGDFGKMQREETDELKKNYCSTHNIPLFEIRYDENIRDKLDEILLKIAGNETTSRGGDTIV